MAFVPLYSPNSEPEQLAIVALLEAHDIPCFVKNGVFGTLYPGVSAGPLRREIRVPEEDLAVARELIRDFEEEPQSPLK